ncbi:MAG: DUF1413 domain-containing protein [Rhodoferax sp.]|jgi:hypothetical protein|nr:DUF1413 domain-containing protein [Rhodoferax sp.]
MLTELELDIAKKVLAKTPSGQYKLEELYGDLWSNNKSPTTFGKRFKKSVLAGHLQNIALVEKDGDNAWIYRVNRI